MAVRGRRHKRIRSLGADGKSALTNPGRKFRIASSEKYAVFGCYFLKLGILTAGAFKRRIARVQADAAAGGGLVDFQLIAIFGNRKGVFGDVDILFLSGETGRDPFEDSPCRTPEEERAGKGKVVSMDVKQQTRQCLEYIKNKLEMMDATLKHIVMFRYYLPRREDVFDMRDEMYRFFEEFEPDLRAHPRPATLLRGVGIDLKEMLVEIEAWAVVPRKK